VVRDAVPIFDRPTHAQPAPVQAQPAPAQVAA
jgi:hypothetical protein